MARWLEELSQYDLVFQYRARLKHYNVDGLSWKEIDQEEEVGPIYPAEDAHIALECRRSGPDSRKKWII